MEPNLIPDPGIENVEPQEIPPTAGEFPQEDDPEVLPYKISFAKYNADECEIDGMHSENAKAILVMMRDIGLYFTSAENYWTKSTQRPEIKSIACDGKYKAVYRGLEDDTEVKEIKFQRNKKDKFFIDVRFFFFSLEIERTFYVIAARQSHYDTDKGDYHAKARR